MPSSKFVLLIPFGTTGAQEPLTNGQVLAREIIQELIEMNT